MSYIVFIFLEDIHVFAEEERISFREDTVHMQELRRLHISDEHQRAHYRVREQYTLYIFI